MLHRRQFLDFSLLAMCGQLRGVERLDVRAIDRSRVLKAADRYLGQSPVTITASHSPRSAGGRRDFFSEGDYWWPDPKNPDGPYIQRDGMTNPDNFVAHREALLGLSVQMPALTAAWLITRQNRYADHAVRHLRAWFIDPETRMNPNLQYAQAIHGITTGRGIGVIDTVHLVEVARAISHLESAGKLSPSERASLSKWFGDYLTWLTTSKNGLEEREAKNNHGSCWALQAAEFARYTGDTRIAGFCRDRLKTVLIPHQIAPDGSFPEELRRTKPYGYCLFNLDILTTVCQTLSTPDDDLFAFQGSNGVGMKQAMEFMVPFIADKKKWTRPPDVMYFDEWPVRQPSLLFAGMALRKPEYIALWRKLDPDPATPEIIRNFPVRQPVLWVP